MLKKLFYLSAGSRRWGTGHLRRSAELIQVLRQKGLNIDAAALVPDAGEMKKLSGFTNEYDRQVQSLVKIGAVKADGIVIDVHSDFQPELFSWLEKQRLSAVALDWYYKTGEFVVAVANLRGGAEALKYAIIRREFHDARMKRSASVNTYNAVAVIGGGDNRNHIDRICGIFAEDSRFAGKKIVTVLGPLANSMFTGHSGVSAGTVTILRNPENIADIMAGASVGITNGGTSLMEFTMLGVPTIIFPQSQEEENFIGPFLEYGCAVTGSLDKKKFIEQIMELWENKMVLTIMSERAKELIDGQGTERIAALILKTFFQDGHEIKVSCACHKGG